MLKPKIIILSGYGLNCEDETAAAFTIAGGRASIVHINDLIAAPKMMVDYQILAIPGGFSFGDDLGSGHAYANKLKNHLLDSLNNFIDGDKLVIGICNGFQILTEAGLLPGALLANNNARYTTRWVDLKLTGPSPWTIGLKNLSLPIAHGEGKFFAHKKTLSDLQQNQAIAFKYTKGEICNYQNLTANPNGSLLDIAAITAEQGRVLGMMPHPERAIYFTQNPKWPVLKEQLLRAGKPLPTDGQGLQIFQNAINYFKN